MAARPSLFWRGVAKRVGVGVLGLGFSNLGYWLAMKGPCLAVLEEG